MKTAVVVPLVTERPGGPTHRILIGPEWRAIRDDPGHCRDRAGCWEQKAPAASRASGARMVHVVGMNLTGYTVTIELSDGQCLHCNLLPALELFKRESGT